MSLEIFLITPQGFCAGVSRALEIVEKCLQKYGKPLYVKHEIVHNKRVVEDLKKQGVIFVNELHEIPNNSTVIFSAHGVSRQIEIEALAKNLNIIDATCPLVKKVHKKAIDLHEKKYQIILIGHTGHPEVVGTYGRVASNIFLVTSIEDVKKLNLNPKEPIGYITQTTLSIADTQDIVDAIKEKYPSVDEKSSKNICYATENRQQAIKALINNLDALLVVGSNNSSNSNRLKEIGLSHNKPSFLIDSPTEIPFDLLHNVNKLGISAGASAPNVAIQEIIVALQKFKKCKITNFTFTEENVTFFLPKELR
ncbi:4-hydroxy-3-methylbut-2-enyl diphosphate reductase [Candidatus Hepatincola sp. Av]